MYIGLEDVISNALIALMEKENRSYVSLETLVKYGAVVVRQLQENSYEVVLLISRNYTSEVIRNYSDFFEIKDDDLGKESVFLKQGKTQADLRERFRAYLSLEVLKAFINETSLSELGV